MRVFLALPLPDPVKDWLTTIQPAAIKGVRIVGRDDLHLTLHFLGELERASIPKAVTALQQIHGRAFPLQLRGTGGFGRKRLPHVLWIGASEHELLKSLHRHSGDVLAHTTGFQPETRRFHPHVTLARVKPYANASSIAEYLASRQEAVGEPFEVDRFVLYQSDPSGSGPRYVELAGFPLIPRP